MDSLYRAGRATEHQTTVTVGTFNRKHTSTDPGGYLPVRAEWGFFSHIKAYRCTSPALRIDIRATPTRPQSTLTPRCFFLGRHPGQTGTGCFQQGEDWKVRSMLYVAFRKPRSTGGVCTKHRRCVHEAQAVCARSTGVVRTTHRRCAHDAKA